MSIQSVVPSWIRFSQGKWEQHKQKLIQWANPSCGLEPRQVLGTVADARLFQVLAVRGGACRDDLSPLEPLAVAAVQEVNEEHGGQGNIPWTALLACDLVNALQSVGCSVHAGVVDTMSGWLPRVQTSREQEAVSYHWKLGFVALALGHRAVYYRVAGYNIDGSIPFQAGRTFQFNMHGLLGHLAGALEEEAAAHDVLPAWNDLLASYEELARAGILSLGNLLWIARIIHHSIAQQPLAGVADFLHDSIWNAAGLRP